MNDLRLILHQLGNLAQPIAYHVEKLGEIRSDDPTFNTAMKALPERMAAFNRTLDRLRILAKPVELERARVDLVALLKSVWNDVASEKPFKGIQAQWIFPDGAPASSRLEAGAPMNADSYWLHLGLHELLLNAAEAAAQSNTRSVEFHVSAQDKESPFAPRKDELLRSKSRLCWRIEIDDSGPGLPAEAAREALFFSTKADTAAGLGLPIARHILAAHGGELLFERRGSAGIQPAGSRRSAVEETCRVVVLLPQA